LVTQKKIYKYYYVRVSEKGFKGIIIIIFNGRKKELPLII